ncbi:MAG: hypothetical protein KUG81_09335 [Gammaproteobacteria bacterium]|nr:hypothetical protein [Gammaproteobacteria bacterium]
MQIKWLLAQDSLDESLRFISVPANAKKRLLNMDPEKEGNKDSLIAIYLPMSNKRGGESKKLRGRIIGTVRLHEMENKDLITKYDYIDNETEKCWPYGWPCKDVFRLDTETAIDLKEIIEDINGEGSFVRFTAPLRSGPIELEGEIRTRIEAAVSRTRARKEKL